MTTITIANYDEAANIGTDRGWVRLLTNGTHFFIVFQDGDETEGEVLYSVGYAAFSDLAYAYRKVLRLMLAEATRRITGYRD